MLTGIAALFGAGVAVLMGFLKHVLEPAKLMKKTETLHWEAKEKRLNVEDRTRRVVTPSKAEVDLHGAPYREKERDLLAGYAKEKERLKSEPLIASEEDPESTD